MPRTEPKREPIFFFLPLTFGALISVTMLESYGIGFVISLVECSLFKYHKAHHGQQITFNNEEKGKVFFFKNSILILNSMNCTVIVIDIGDMHIS